MSKITNTFEPFPWESVTPSPIIGVDEVGRGCLAGSVYAAAVILGDNYPKGLTDSKKLSAKKRKTFSLEILETCTVSLGFATVDEIGEINILQASLLAMKRAVLGLGVQGGHILVDGNQKIPGMSGWAQTTVVKGDLRALPIAAASIVAKVIRDEEIADLATTYPGYGLETHKGYATKAHKAAIAELGPTPIHRTTFAGVKEFLPRPR